MSNHNDTYGLDPKLVKLMEDQLNELCPVECRPQMRVYATYTLATEDWPKSLRIIYSK